MPDVNKAVTELEESTTVETDSSAGESDAPVSESATEENATSGELDGEGTQESATAGDEVSSDSGENESHLSDRTNRRIRQLVDENKKLKGQLGDFGHGSRPTVPSSTLPWQANGEPKEITVEDYQRDVATIASQIVEAKLTAERERNRLYVEVSEVEKSYPELNPDSQGYDADLANRVLKSFQKIQKGDPSASLKEFVNDLMTVREKGAESAKQQVSARVVDDAAKQAVSMTNQGGQRPKSEEQLADLLAKGEISLEEVESKYSLQS